MLEHGRGEHGAVDEDGLLAHADAVSLQQRLDLSGGSPGEIGKNPRIGGSPQADEQVDAGALRAQRAEWRVLRYDVPAGDARVVQPRDATDGKSAAIQRDADLLDCEN